MVDITDNIKEHVKDKVRIIKLYRIIIKYENIIHHLEKLYLNSNVHINSVFNFRKILDYKTTQFFSDYNDIFFEIDYIYSTDSDTIIISINNYYYIKINIVNDYFTY